MVVRIRHEAATVIAHLLPHHQALSVKGTAGEEIVFELVSDDFDSVLVLLGPGIDGFVHDDDGAGGGQLMAADFDQAAAAARQILQGSASRSRQ